MSDLILRQLKLGPMDNFVYLIGDRRLGEAAVVDPAWDVPAIAAEAKRSGLKITKLLLTHSHHDHINGVDRLLDELDADATVHMLADEINFSGFKAPNLKPVRGGDKIKVGGLSLEVLHTPGHTPGSTCYRTDDLLVTGDTLFVDGCGRCDMVGGNPEVMYKTLTDLTTKLPSDTVMFPGHDYGAVPSVTLAEQKQTNPYLRFTTVQDFVAHRMRPRR